MLNSSLSYQKLNNTSPISNLNKINHFYLNQIKNDDSISNISSSTIKQKIKKKQINQNKQQRNQIHVDQIKSKDEKTDGKTFIFKKKKMSQKEKHVLNESYNNSSTYFKQLPNIILNSQLKGPRLNEINKVIPYSIVGSISQYEKELKIKDSQNKANVKLKQQQRLSQSNSICLNNSNIGISRKSNRAITSDKQAVQSVNINNQPPSQSQFLNQSLQSGIVYKTNNDKIILKMYNSIKERIENQTTDNLNKTISYSGDDDVSIKNRMKNNKENTVNHHPSSSTVDNMKMNKNQNMSKSLSISIPDNEVRVIRKYDKEVIAKLRTRLKSHYNSFLNKFEKQNKPKERSIPFELRSLLNRQEKALFLNEKEEKEMMISKKMLSLKSYKLDEDLIINKTEIGKMKKIVEVLVSNENENTSINKEGIDNTDNTFKESRNIRNDWLLFDRNNNDKYKNGYNWEFSLRVDDRNYVKDRHINPNTIQRNHSYIDNNTSIHKYNKVSSGIYSTIIDKPKMNEYIIPKIDLTSKTTRNSQRKVENISRREGIKKENEAFISKVDIYKILIEKKIEEKTMLNSKYKGNRGSINLNIDNTSIKDYLIKDYNRIEPFERIIQMERNRLIGENLLQFEVDMFKNIKGKKIVYGSNYNPQTMKEYSIDDVKEEIYAVDYKYKY